MENILEIAHRGSSDCFKDNTINAFIAALDEDFDMVECDIQLCATNEIIVFHDTYINSKMIKDLSFNDLLDEDKDIITLGEFFSIPGMKESKVYLDLKGEIELSDALIEFLEDNEDIDRRNLYIASYNMKHLEILKLLDNTLKLGLISENNFNDAILIKLVQESLIKFVALHWSTLDNDTIELLRVFDIKVFTYTCKNNMVLKQIEKFKVDGIVSNYKFKN